MKCTFSFDRPFVWGHTVGRITVVWIQSNPPLILPWLVKCIPVQTSASPPHGTYTSASRLSPSLCESELREWNWNWIWPSELPGNTVLILCTTTVHQPGAYIDCTHYVHAHCLPSCRQRRNSWWKDSSVQWSIHGIFAQFTPSFLCVSLGHVLHPTPQPHIHWLCSQCTKQITDRNVHHWNENAVSGMHHNTIWRMHDLYISASCMDCYTPDWQLSM